jgi:SRSO17 transposase
MTNLEGNIQLVVAQLYSLRNWIEYGFTQIKNELRWADYRLTDYPSIERWWSIVFSAYLLVSIHAQSDRSISDELTHYHSNKLHNPSQLIAQ